MKQAVAVSYPASLSLAADLMGQKDRTRVSSRASRLDYF